LQCKLYLQLKFKGIQKVPKFLHLRAHHPKSFRKCQNFYNWGRIVPRVSESAKVFTLESASSQEFQKVSKFLHLRAHRPKSFRKCQNFYTWGHIVPRVYSSLKRHTFFSIKISALELALAAPYFIVKIVKFLMPLPCKCSPEIVDNKLMTKLIHRHT